MTSLTLVSAENFQVTYEDNYGKSDEEKYADTKIHPTFQNVKFNKVLDIGRIPLSSLP